MSILAIFLELNICLSQQQIVDCFKAFAKCEKDGYDEYDDFCILMVLHYYLHQTEWISNENQVKDFDIDIIRYLFELVGEDAETLKEYGYMAGKHWLLKYQLFYYYKYDDDFKNRVYYYIARLSKKKQNLSRKKRIVINFCRPHHVHVEKNDNDAIDQFYLKLLDMGFSFTTL